MKFSLKHIALGTAIAVSSLSALAADTIKIGSVLSVTGPAAFLGDPELKTLQCFQFRVTQERSWAGDGQHRTDFDGVSRQGRQ